MGANALTLHRLLRAKRQVSVARSIAAPVGGWNARDALGAMSEMDAVTLTNMFPGPTSINLRYGYTKHATGLDAQVESLPVWNGPSSSKIFGFTSTKAYDVTSAGAVGAAALTGLSNARWQHINVSTTAGNYLMAVNGADKAAFYTGSAWARDGDGAPYNISGVDSATCAHINLFKNMVWLVKSATLDAYYLPTGAIGGAATKVSMNGIAKKGGYLMAMATWTIDAGYGVDDLAVFITSEGEVIVYRGTDPTSTATWSLVGVWAIGSPVGRRCFLKYAGDLLIITQDGLVPLSGALQSSRLNPRVALTDKIQSAVSTAVSNYGSNFGWEVFYFPKQNQLYLNVPVTAGAAQQQYVMNTITKAWCNFTGWSANCFALMTDIAYFGSNTYVAKAWNTIADNGAVINGLGFQAFNYFKDLATRKRFTMMRVFLLTNGSPTLYGAVNTDFDTNEPTATLSFTPTNYGVWDSGIWDTAIWGTDLVPQNNWQGANGTGICGAPVIKISSAGIQVQWISTTVVYEPSRGVLL